MLKLDPIIEAAPMGDSRRNKRAQKIVLSLIQGNQAHGKNGASPPGKKDSWAHTVGCSRFYSNDSLPLPVLYQPCRALLADLVQPGQRAYVIHDLSPIDYSHHNDKSDRIQIGNKYGLGYEMFSALVLNAEGRPLGPIVQEVRTSAGCLSSEAEQPLPFVDHYTQVERAVDAAERHLPERDLVHVTDREFDDLSLQRALSDNSRKYIIRASQLSRKVLLRTQTTTLRSAVRAAPRYSGGTVDREGKTYDVRLANTFVWFNGYSWRGVKRGAKPKQGPALGVRVVIVELHYNGRRAYQWVLLTNLQDPAEDIAQIYTWRWRVERLFYFIKIGMKLETWGEQDGIRIARRLTLTSLAAMAVYQLQGAADDPAFVETIQYVAKLGGWLGRRRDPIGPIVLMRGMMCIIIAIAMLEELGPEGLRATAQQVSEALGLPLPGVHPPG